MSAAIQPNCFKCLPIALAIICGGFACLLSSPSHAQPSNAQPSNAQPSIAQATLTQPITKQAITKQASGNRANRSLSLRTETTVLSEQSPETPLAQTLTLFDNAIAYDIQLPEKSQITVFDIGRGQIILLDTTRKLRTTISTSVLMDFMASLREKAMELGKADLLGAGTQPTADPSTGIYRAGFPGVLYLAKTQPAFSEAHARLYHEFSNWATRLNTFHHPHGAPFARLALNDHLAQGGVFPSEITCQTREGEQSSVIRSQHHFSPMLAVQDRALIFEIGGMLTTFSDVDTNQFCQPAAQQLE